MKFKYILGENKKTGNDAVVIFDIIQQHIDVANQMTNIIPQSAGFISFNDLKTQCFGESISLKLKAEQFDARRIEALMRLS